MSKRRIFDHICVSTWPTLEWLATMKHFPLSTKSQMQNFWTIWIEIKLQAISSWLHWSRLPLQIYHLTVDLNPCSDTKINFSFYCCKITSQVKVCFLLIDHVTRELSLMIKTLWKCLRNSGQRNLLMKISKITPEWKMFIAKYPGSETVTETILKWAKRETFELFMTEKHSDGFFQPLMTRWRRRIIFQNV